MENNGREENKTVVIEPDLRSIRRVNRERPPSPTPEPEDGDIETMKKFNAGTNKSAAAGSKSLNTKRHHEHTENLPLNAGTNESAAAGSTSLNTKRLHEHTENLPLNAGINKSAAAGSTSLNTIKVGRKDKRHKNGEMRIADDVKRTEIKRSVPSNDIKESFLNRKRAKISEAIAAERRKRREYVIQAFDGIPRGFCPIKDLDAKLAASMRKFAYLALEDFNGQERKDYRFVDLKTVGWQIVNGTKYCIIFGALANGHYDTFEAEVVQRLVGRRHEVNMVHSVGMKKSSIWRSGTLQEIN